MTERNRGSRIIPEVEEVGDESKEIEIELPHGRPADPRKPGRKFPLPHEVGKGARRPWPHERLESR
jgi:hypothetical protein